MQGKVICNGGRTDVSLSDDYVLRHPASIRYLCNKNPSLHDMAAAKFAGSGYADCSSLKELVHSISWHQEEQMACKQQAKLSLLLLQNCKVIRGLVVS